MQRSSPTRTRRSVPAAADTMTPAGTRRRRPRSAAAPVSADERHRMIASAAYFRAESRGFAPGAELEDWLDAEREVEDRLRSDGTRAP